MWLLDEKRLGGKECPAGISETVYVDRDRTELPFARMEDDAGELLSKMKGVLVVKQGVQLLFRITSQ